MVLLAALAMAAIPPNSPPPQRVVAERQAAAMVRILPGAALHFSVIEQTAPAMLRDAQVRTPDGAFQPARLVEFE